MFKLIVFLCVIAGAFAAQQTEILPRLDGRIVGGHPTPIEDHPYQVGLEAVIVYVCGGSIISSTYVMTAAHCMYYPTAVYTVRAGSAVMGSGGVTRHILRAIIHPDYDDNLIDYDVALLRVLGRFHLDLTIAAVPLPSQDEPVDTGALAEVTGWGRLSEGGSMTTTLMEVTVPIVSQEQCAAAHGSRYITDRMVCAGYTAGGSDACTGDSGGALVVNGTQVGIVSWGRGCARPNYPGVYTRVAAIRDWIAQRAGV